MKKAVQKLLITIDQRIQFMWECKNHMEVSSPIRRPKAYRSAAIAFCLRSVMEAISVMTSSFAGTKGRNSKTCAWGVQHIDGKKAKL